MSSSDPFPSAPTHPLPAYLLDEDPGNEEDELLLAAQAGALSLLPRKGTSQIRAPNPVIFSVVREITQEDLPNISPPRGTASLPTIDKLRSSHHQIAQLIAAGRADYDVALITGYSAAYITRMKNNPTFQGLLAHYEGVEQLQFADAMERLKVLGLDAAEELQERLATNGEDFSVGELTELVNLTIVRPAVASVKAGGAVAAASAAPRAFEIVFRASSRSGGERGRSSEIIEGEVNK